MYYQIQARGKHGDWDSEYISSDPEATEFKTHAEAQQAIDELRSQGGDYENQEYRILPK